MPGNGRLEIAGTISGSLSPTREISGGLSAPKERAGTNDYEQLINRPKFNGVTVEGSKESQDYNLTLSVQEIERILYLD